MTPVRILTSPLNPSGSSITSSSIFVGLVQKARRITRLSRRASLDNRDVFIVMVTSPLGKSLALLCSDVASNDDNDCNEQPRYL